MKKENNAGYSLIEVLAAILLLGILSVPLCNSLVMGHKMNVKSQTLLQAQLEVSAAVEQLMAEGIREGKDYEELGNEMNVEISIAQEINAEQPYYTVTVKSLTDKSVDVTTSVRYGGTVAADPGTGEGAGE